MNNRTEYPTGPVTAPVVTFSNIPLDDEPVAPVLPEAPTTIDVVEVQFNANGKSYYFDPGALELAAGDEVIVETTRGPEYGFCRGARKTVPISSVSQPLRNVIRMATDKDRASRQSYMAMAPRAMEICQKKIEEHGLELKLVSAEYSFDGSRILFHFTADGRVDFRELVRDLASEFHTRIELRQIGVRDEAKLLGGLGICGRPFCCKQFLRDFQPVSIKMAKTQNLSLNPTKISGCCGRLMCCLQYEQEAYESLLKTCPKQESIVNTYEGKGTVTEVSLLKETVKVRLDSDPSSPKIYKNDEVEVLRNGKGRKTDPPIPDDIPPLPKPEPSPQEAEPLSDFEEALSRWSEYVSSTPSQTEVAQPLQTAQASQPERRNSGGRSRNNYRGRNSSRQKASKGQASQQQKAPQTASNSARSAQGGGKKRDGGRPRNYRRKSSKNGEQK